MSHLFSPFTLGRLTLANRIVIAPMCQYSAQDGQATGWHTIHLGHLALSGAGLLIMEATAVSPEGRISVADLGLWSDATEAALGRALQTVRRYSSMPIGIQLAHAGRKASTKAPWIGSGQVTVADGGWIPVAPSALPFAETDQAPHALEQSEMREIVAAFVAAARRAERLGIDLIELHAAHGYLLHQFLSPLTNTRDDEFGGSLENRLRFPLQVFDAVRAAVSPSMPVGIRISASDWVAGGWDIEQSVTLSLALRERGCSYIHVSSGGLSPHQQIAVGPNYQVPLAERIHAATGMPTIAVGMITEAQQAEAIIADGRADMVALARGILYDPRWPWHAAATLGAQVAAPMQYWRSTPHGVGPLFVSPDD